MNEYRRILACVIWYLGDFCSGYLQIV